MAYAAKDYSQLIGMEGFSETLLKNHFTLYQGYVTNTNKLIDTARPMAKDGKIGTPGIRRAEAAVRLRVQRHATPRVLLREPGRQGQPGRVGQLRRASWPSDFGSYEAWEKDFRATGAMRGIGWAILYQDNVTGRLFNLWINEHETGHLAGCTPLLIMDVFEHAFMIDYGLKRADYIEAFFKNINREAVESRLS